MILMWRRQKKTVLSYRHPIDDDPSWDIQESSFVSITVIPSLLFSGRRKILNRLWGPYQLLVPRAAC